MNASYLRTGPLEEMLFALAGAITLLSSALAAMRSVIYEHRDRPRASAKAVAV